MYIPLVLVAILACRVGIIAFPRSHSSLLLDNNDIETRSITSRYDSGLVSVHSKNGNAPVSTDGISDIPANDFRLEPRAEGQRQQKHGAGGKKQVSGQPKAKPQHSQGGHGQGQSHPQGEGSGGGQEKIGPSLKHTRIIPVGTNPLNGLPVPSRAKGHATTAGTNPINGLPVPSGHAKTAHAKSQQTVPPGTNPINGLPAPKGKPTFKSFKSQPPHSITSTPKITTHSPTKHPSSSISHVNHSQPSAKKPSYTLVTTHSTSDKAQGVIGSKSESKPNFCAPRGCTFSSAKSR